MYRFDSEYLFSFEPHQTYARRYIDLMHQGWNADEIELELARQRQAPLFIDLDHPLKHGDPGGQGSDWALIRDRSVENIRRAFAQSGRTISEAAKYMLRRFDLAQGRGRGLGMTQQALSKLIKTPEKMDRGQVAILVEYLECTLDYMRGLVDDPGQFYGSASTELIKTIYENLPPEGRALASEILISITARYALVDKWIADSNRLAHGDGTDSGAADGA